MTGQKGCVVAVVCTYHFGELVFGYKRKDARQETYEYGPVSIAVSTHSPGRPPVASAVSGLGLRCKARSVWRTTVLAGKLPPAQETR